MKKNLKIKKSNFEGSIYILESLFNLCLTLIVFATILCKTNSKNESIDALFLAICLGIDALLIFISIKMKKYARKRLEQIERHPDQSTGISNKILQLEKRKKVLNSIKIIFLTTVCLCS